MSLEEPSGEAGEDFSSKGPESVPGSPSKSDEPELDRDEFSDQEQRGEPWVRAGVILVERTFVSSCGQVAVQPEDGMYA